MHLVWNKSVFYWASHALEWNPICSKKVYILRWFECLLARTRQACSSHHPIVFQINYSGNSEVAMMSSPSDNDDNDDFNVRKCTLLKSGAFSGKVEKPLKSTFFLSKCYIVWLKCCNSCVHSMHSMIHTILLQVEICWNSRFDFLWLSKIASLHIEKATPLIHVIHVALVTALN